MATTASNQKSGRAVAQARRQALASQGKQALQQSASSPARAATQAAPAKPAPAAQPAAPAPGRAAAQANSGRALAQARRSAMAQAGKPAVNNGMRTRSSTQAKQAAARPGQNGTCQCGKHNEPQSQEAATPAQAQPATQPRGTLRRNGASGPARNDKQRLRERRVAAKRDGKMEKPAGRMIAHARRSALASRGKAAANAANPSTATLARQANPKLTSRELAQQVRSMRSRNGGNGNPKKQPSGRVRPGRDGGNQQGGASDATWKVGVSATAHGGSVTGTQVGRTATTTGSESGTCHAVTGTEYFGAEIFQTFCQREPSPNPPKVSQSHTGQGHTVTGSRVGRSQRVTGDEPGTCQSVTGTEYLAVDDQQTYCPTPTGGQPQAQPQPAPAAPAPAASRVTSGQQPRNLPVMGPRKVGESTTLRGGQVTGSRVGRSERVTGDESGSCYPVSGDEYVDQGQYQAFCGYNVAPEPSKVGESRTLRQQWVSGTQTGRSTRVTGDEPGTCKAVTGTPYAGLEQYQNYCEPPAAQAMQQRQRAMGAPPLTGQQPGINGVMTGAERGACEPVSGTPYVGNDQAAAACGTRAAMPGESDFPQALDADAGSAAPGQRFSVMSPAQQAQQAHQAHQAGSAVTGSRYEQGRITGPFGMATDKVTGTEQFRFDQKYAQAEVVDLPPPEAADAVETDSVKPRITGEGQAIGQRITGDDWERGERVTGTEGASAMRRNPTRPGPMSAMPAVPRKRNEDVDPPTNRVTGSSGSTERGAMVTYSGGARG